MFSNIQIKDLNYQLIEKLTGKEKVGIDEQGRLYVVKDSGIFSAVKNIFFKTNPKVGQAAVEYAIDKFQNREFKELEKGKESYLKLQEHLHKVHLLDENNSTAIALAWYNQRYIYLVQSGLQKEIAEAMITMEVSQDQNVSPEIRGSLMPQQTSGGTSGSYFLKNRQGEKIGIFKPRDEEIYMPNNPKGYVRPDDNRRMGPRTGHQPGTSWLKEIAAWQLDQGELAKVPFTIDIFLPFPKQVGSQETIVKKGSFQLFASGKPVEELTTEEIQKIPISEVQKIALFDLSIGNADRNLGNLLYDNQKEVLVPIDHGLSLLDSLDWVENGMMSISEANCHWLTWPQVKQPLNQEAMSWIENYDIDKKNEILKKTGISEASIREHSLRIIFLKEAFQRGFNLYEVGDFCIRTNENQKCLLEQISHSVFFKLMDLDKLSDETFFLKTFKEEAATELSKLSKKNA